MKQNLSKRVAQSMRNEISNMQIGECIVYPLEKLNSVRATASDLVTQSYGTEHPKMLSTRVNRANKTVTVIRKK